jgi:hypothetical protein
MRKKNAQEEPMNIGIYSPMALAGWLLASGIFSPLYAQESGKATHLGSVARQALLYFAKPGKGDFKDYLRMIRPARVSAILRERLVASIEKNAIVSPSVQRQAKLDALRVILAYHDRIGLEVKILSLRMAWAGFLEGAAVVISETAIDILSTEELQAVVAHELGHEYFAAEYDRARKNNQYDKVKEVELRCDGVALITMKSLGLNPNSFLSGVSRLTKFNEEHGARSNPDLMTSLDERMRFCQAMIKLVEISFSKPHKTANQ